MTNSIEELRLEYIANYYANKIQQIPNKEEVLEDTKKVINQIVAELPSKD